MPQSLTQAALEVLRDRRSAELALTAPLLLWKAPLRQLERESWAHTDPSHPPSPSKPGESLVFPLIKAAHTRNPFAMGITVGRIATNDVQLNDPSISRFHAFFMVDERTGLWHLTDAESSNGTYVAGQRLAPNLRQKLSDDVMVRFGDLELRFFTPPAFIRFVENPT
jgi:hypothetical protein